VAASRICMINQISQALNLERRVRSIQKVFIKKQLMKKIQKLSIKQIILIKTFVKKFTLNFRLKKKKRGVATFV
jgi:hypothetical protein